MRYFFESMEGLTRGRTTRVISYRLATGQRADRIIVLADGRVVEQETHTARPAADGASAWRYREQTARTASVETVAPARAIR